jgi:hypothetical protein
MKDEDLNNRMDHILDNSKNILIANGAEYLGSEEIKMKICYPNSVGESNTKKSHRKFFRFDL